MMKNEQPEEDAEKYYGDIINLPPHRSPNRTPMPMEKRAAQFGAFSPLTGHDQAIEQAIQNNIQTVADREHMEEYVD